MRGFSGAELDGFALGLWPGHIIAPTSTTAAAGPAGSFPMHRFAMKGSGLDSGVGPLEQARQPPLGEFDPPGIRIAMPLSGLQIEIKLARQVLRPAQLVVNLRECPVHVRIVSFIGRELYGKWS